MCFSRSLRRSSLNATKPPEAAAGLLAAVFLLLTQKVIFYAQSGATKPHLEPNRSQQLPLYF